MRTLSIASVINKNQLASDVPWLVAVKVDVIDPQTLSVITTIRMVANNEHITLGGNLFLASNFSLDISESENELPTVSLKITDITQTVQAYMQAYQGGLGSHVTVYFFPAESTTVAKADITYDFDVISASSNSSNYTTTWSLGAENPLTLAVPSRRQSRNRCGWQFKDGNCNYTGPATICDLDYSSVNGCLGHDNQEFFGGFPAIRIRNL